MPTKENLAWQYYRDFHLYAGDLYPNQYNYIDCLRLAEKTFEIKRLAAEKKSHILVHYYLRPEFHEIAEKLGDSLALSKYMREVQAERVDFQAVFFMGATAKIIAGNNTRVFVGDSPKVLGCSLVSGTDHQWISAWKRENPDGILITYINSDTYTKSISNFISTSRNTDKIIAHVARKFPGQKILFLPDKFLGQVMKIRALRLLEQERIKIDPDLIEIYKQPFGGFNACCYVHEKLGRDSILVTMAEHPNAEVMIHPECGCASFCMYQIEQNIIPADKAFFLSTEQMLRRAETSPAKEFIVATEPGMLYALRKRLPNKIFIPVSATAHCDFMKGNTLDKLLRSLREDRLEIVICKNCADCVDPKTPYEDDRVIHIPKVIADNARLGIEPMLSI
ncbi:MAG: quinolinate synthase NadA [bacterium]|nr:quinolinate synthase NadA [bacterium]